MEFEQSDFNTDRTFNLIFSASELTTKGILKKN